ncbi:hypothetical protein [Aquimonas sp.]|uniref:hypothetical protein n=1 Tax=Aquimonas sp. TaxID=1872588 RepID=UPI0037BF9437
METYVAWGFRGNPFNVRSLPPDQTGAELLVGRSTELATLTRRINNPPKLPTLEGMNGVGKSSIVNVAGFSCFNAFAADPGKPLYIPCRKIFQFTPTSSRDSFVMEVLLEVAQTLIEYSSQIEGDRLRSVVEATGLRDWINAPQMRSIQGTLGPLGGGRSVETNTGEGYTQSGFPSTVKNILSCVFPAEGSGGIICVIDNLELLQTSEAARDLLEALRDELFNVQGLRWVLCGALGIVRGVTSSPRLDGMMFDPIDVKKIPDECVGEIYTSRVEAFAASESPYLPLLQGDFVRLYGILLGNIRALLGHTDEFCQFVSEQDLHPDSEADKADLFRNWLEQKCRAAYDSAKPVVGGRAWEVFADAVSVDGLFAPSDFEHFRFNSSQAFRPHVKDLEDAGLVVSTKDEGDRRRKTIQITPRGWLVNHYRANAAGA